MLTCARVASCVMLPCARFAARWMLARSFARLLALVLLQVRCLLPLVLLHVMLTCARAGSWVMPTCTRVAALCMLARDLARVSMPTLYLPVIWKLTSGKSNRQYETV